MTTEDYVMSWERELLWKSGQNCADCGNDLHVTDDVYLIQVVYGGYDEQGNFNHFILQHNGDYQFEPQFFHTSCWEELWEDFASLLEDQPPLIEPSPQLQIAECIGCASSIRANETSGLLSLGALHRSSRSPDGSSTACFAPRQETPDMICLACLYHFNKELFEMWDELLNSGVCEEGLNERCWRNGTCLNGCHHHALVK